VDYPNCRGTALKVLRPIRWARYLCKSAKWARERLNQMRRLSIKRAGVLRWVSEKCAKTVKNGLKRAKICERYAKSGAKRAKR